MLPIRPRTLGSSVGITIRGRSVRLRGLRRSRTDIVRWLLLLGPRLVAAAAGNGGLVVSEFVGIGAAAELMGVRMYLAIPFSAALLWALITFGCYGWRETMVLAMTLVFCA